MPENEHSFRTGVGYVLIATLGWSLSGLFVRLLPGLDGWQINCWRGFWLAMALLSYLVVRYGRNTGKRFAMIPIAGMVLSALFFATGTTFYVTSLTMVSTATVSIIGATSPLFAGLLSPWVTGEKPGILAWFSAALALAGVTVIARGGLEAGHIMGLMTSFGVPITFALQTLLLRRYRNYDMMPAICVGGLLSFIAAGFFSSFASSTNNAFTLDWHAMLLLMLMGPLQLAIPLVFYGMGARAVPAVTLALISMLDAVINPFWPWLFVGEVPERPSFIGGGIILVAVLLSIVGENLINKFRRAS
jgi:drug/metabolite transporter, DME family